MVTNNLWHNFPTVDVLDENSRVLYSTKSYDSTSATYSDASKWLSKIKQDLRKLDQFTNKTWNGVKVNETMYDNKCFNMVLPNISLTDAQRQVLQQVKDYAETLGLCIKVYITK